MTHNIRKYYEWEASLKEGTKVEARFTNNNSYYSFPGIITKVNNSSFRVENLESFDSEIGGTYKKGFSFVIQKSNYGMGSRTWSKNNGVFPI